MECAKAEEDIIASQLGIIEEAIDLGPLDSLAGYHLRRASAVVSADFSRAFEGTGMRQVLFGILSVISANPGINQGNVARALGIQRPNMVALVNDLIDRGYVTRHVDRRDRRAFLLNLTDAGEAAVAAALASIHIHEERVLRGLSARERATLVRLLEHIEVNGDSRKA